MIVGFPIEQWYDCFCYYYYLKYWFMFVFFGVTEARKQVMDATERLGGQYSPNLHPQCTHLVVQISS